MGVRWLERMDLPDEPMPRQPLIEIVGHQRVLIEHHSGVTQYGREKIRVKVRFGTVCISGAGLELARMTAEQLIICGCIEAVELERQGKQ